MTAHSNVTASICIVLLGLWGTVYGGSIDTIEELDAASLFSFALMGDHKAAPPPGESNIMMTRMGNWIEAHDEFCIGYGDHVNGKEELDGDMDQTVTNPFLKFIAEDPWFGQNFYPNIGDHDNQINPGENPGDKKRVWGAGWVLFNYVGNPQDDYLYNNDIPMGTAPFFNRSNVEFRPATGPQVPDMDDPTIMYDDKMVDYYAWFDHSNYPGIPAGYTVHVISVHNGNESVLARQSVDFMVNKLTELQIERTDKDIIVVVNQNDTWITKAVRNGWMSVLEQDLLLNVADLSVNGNIHKYRLYDEFDSQYNKRQCLWLDGGSVTDDDGVKTGYVEVHVLPNPTRITAQFVRVDLNERLLQEGAIPTDKYDADLVKCYMKEVNGGQISTIDWSQVDDTPIADPESGDPVVSFNTPSGDVTVNKGDDLYVNVDASDPDGINRVYLYKDGVELSRSEGGFPYEWNNPTQTNDVELQNLQAGSFVLMAKAKDVLGNEGTASITVTVWDDAPVEGNLIANGSFENGGSWPDSWSTDANAAWSSSAAQDGFKSLEVTGDIGAVYQEITVTNGVTYNLSLWVNASGITGGQAIFDSWDDYDGSGECQFVINDILDAPGWMQKTGTFTATNTQAVRFRMFSDAAFAGSVLFDNVVLTASGGQPLEGYDAWAADNTVGDKTADDDGDGRSNFLEYVIGGDPASADDVGPTFVKVGDVFEYNYLKRNDDPALTYIVESCTDLSSGIWADVGIVGVNTGTTGDYDNMELTVPADQPQSYIRLKVENP